MVVRRTTSEREGFQGLNRAPRVSERRPTSVTMHSGLAEDRGNASRACIDLAWIEIAMHAWVWYEALGLFRPCLRCVHEDSTSGLDCTVMAPFEYDWLPSPTVEDSAKKIDGQGFSRAQMLCTGALIGLQTADEAERPSASSHNVQCDSSRIVITFVFNRLLAIPRFRFDPLSILYRRRRWPAPRKHSWAGSGRRNLCLRVGKHVPCTCWRE